MMKKNPMKINPSTSDLDNKLRDLFPTLDDVLDDGTLSVDEALLTFSVDSVVVTKQTAENENLIRSILKTGGLKRLNN